MYNSGKKFIKSKLTDDFLRHGTLVFLAANLGSVFNMLYQLYLVRSLSPVNFGIFNSLLALLMIFSVPTGTLQTAVTKFTSSFHAHGQWGKIKIFLSSFTKKILFLGIVFFVVILAANKGISSFFQIPTSAPVVMVGVLMLSAFVMPVVLGGLQGLQMFGWFGLNGVIGGGLKLVLGITLVGLGFSVAGALSAFIIANFAMILLAFFPLKNLILEKSGGSAVESHNNVSEDINFFEIYKYFVPVAVTFFCFMALINVDIILVKHFFPPLEAGFYSVAQMVGKIILFLPMPFIMVMFPKVSNLNAKGENALPILKKSLVFGGGICGIAALGCVLFPSLIIKLLSGKAYLECVPLARIFAITMTFFALVYTLLFYQLSIRKLGFIYPLIGLTLLQIVAIVVFHNNLSQVLYILCANSVLLFIVNLGLIFNFIRMIFPEPQGQEGGLDNIQSYANRTEGK